MHIGIDIGSIPYGRGVSRYTQDLTLALLRQKQTQKMTLFGVGGSSHLNQLETFAQDLEPSFPTKQIIPNFHRMPIRLAHSTWKIADYPKIESSPPPDIFHAWDWIQPRHSQTPLVSTVHDLALLHFPETAHPRIRRRHQSSWQFFKRNQLHLIAVSKTTKKDICSFLGYPEYLVHVVYSALPTAMRKTSDSLTDEMLQQTVRKFELHRPFLLFVGTREPRKNLERLIQAWLPLKKKVDLVIAGEKGWNEPKYQVPELKFLGRVSDRLLGCLYSLADCLVFPSLYEGFGLPILEAFHFGTPVVTSNNSGMREVAGNAAELVEPESVTSIRQGIITILAESASEQQRRLQRMVIRSHLFNWDDTAQQTMAVYRKVIEEQQ